MFYTLIFSQVLFSLIHGVWGVSNNWIGGSGRWNDASQWSLSHVPNPSENVFINLTSNEIILLSGSVVIQELTLTGGMLSIFENDNLTVRNNFYFESGIIETMQIYQDRTVFSSLNVFGDLMFTTSGRKLLKYLTINQYENTCKWYDGSILFTNTTLMVHEEAKFMVYVNNSASVSKSIKSDESRIWFNYYPNRMMNPDAHLIESNPTESGVYDMIVSNVISVYTSKGAGKELFPLLVSQDLSATDYYAHSVLNLELYGDREVMFNKTVSKTIDEDECAHLCRVNYRKWCQSFDYHFYNHTCRLSKNRLSYAGGLVTTVDRPINFSFPVAHYESRTVAREVDSFIIVNGQMNVTNEQELATGSVVFSLNVVVNHLLGINKNVNATFQRNLFLEDGSSTMLAGYALLELSTVDSSLRTASNSVITGDNTTSHSKIVFTNGNHILAGLTQYLHSVKLSDSATVTLNSPVANYVIQGNGYFEVENNSVVLSFTEQTTISFSEVSVRSRSTIFARKLHVTSSLLNVDLHSSISADGMGFGFGVEMGIATTSGPAPGTGYSLGGSGGAHGGRGGVGKVDATGAPYDSLTWPNQAGSAGGIGYYPTDTAGFGGGVIAVYTTILTLNGNISSNGENGKNGGGGGAGGSIAIQTVGIIGNGVLSVAGGHGGYAGGLISGGGGSGGRMAVQCTNTFGFNGTVDVSGGYMHPTYDQVTPEQAGPGTAFITSSSYQIVLTSAFPVQNYLHHLNNGVPVHNYDKSAPETLYYRGAVMKEVSSFDPCLFLYHILGPAPLIISNLSTSCLDNVIGSGAAYLILDNSSFVYRNKSLTIETAAVHLEKAHFPLVSYEVMIKNAGYLHLYTFGKTSKSGYHFDSLHVHDGGNLVVHNETVVTADEALFTDKSVIFVDQQLNLTNSKVKVSAATIQSLKTEEGNLAKVIIEQSTTVTVSGVLNLKGIQLEVYGKLILQDGAHITDEKSKIIIRPFGKLQMPDGGGGASAWNKVTTKFYSNSELLVIGTLSFQAPTVFAANSSRWNITGSLELHEGTTTMAENSILVGTGNIFVKENAIFIPPTHVAYALTPTVHVNYNGMLFFSNRLLSQTFYSFGSQIRSYNGAGMIKVDSRTNVTISKLWMESGELLLASHANSLLTFKGLSGNPIQIANGTVSGNGTIINDVASYCVWKPASAENGLLISQTHFLNYGSLKLTLNGTVNFVQHSQMHNYGTIQVVGEQTWQYPEGLFSFQQLPYQLIDAPQTNFPILYNISIEQCAYYCVHSLMHTTYQAEAHRLKFSDLTCRAFVYQPILQACKLSTNLVEENAINHVNLNVNFGWLAYDKVDAWTVPPLFVNHPSGNISVSSGAEFHTKLNTINWGEIIVSPMGRQVFGKQFEQVKSGEVISHGETAFVLSNYSNQVSGRLKGAGRIAFRQLSSDHGHSHTLNSLEILDERLTLEIASVVAIKSNISQISIESLEISAGGQLIVQSEPLQITAATAVHIYEKGTFSTLNGIIVTDSCTTCYDLKVISPTLVVAGKFDVSQGIISTSANFSIEHSGAVSCSSRGYAVNSSNSNPLLTGQYSLLGSRGGSHAGLGGRGNSEILPFYIYQSKYPHGNFLKANTWGMAGGVWAPNDITNGGGMISINSSFTQVNGILECNGASPSNTLAGGGSGGSLLVQTAILTGNGIISADGGVGGLSAQHTVGQGGGGGGGRIALYRDTTTFNGSVSAIGGAGFQKGSAGTIYSNDYSVSRRQGGSLIVFDAPTDENKDKQLPTIIFEDLSLSGPLEEIRVGSQAKLLIKQRTSPFHVVGPIKGDGTGVIIVSNHTIIQTIPQTPGLTITGIKEFIVANSVLDVSHLTLTASTLVVTPLGRTVHSSVAGIYEFANVSLSASSHLRMSYNAFYDTTHYAAVPVTLNVSDLLQIDASSTLESNGQGYSGSYQDGTDCGNGNACGGFYGGGGGYGGHGGYGFGHELGNGGKSFGLLDHPVSLGSGGGGTLSWIRGGTGGGAIRLNTNRFVLDGQVAVNGFPGSKSGAGGGSGGSVWITCSSIIGTGSISSNGGNGVYSNAHFGGGGSGGRIFIDECQGIDDFQRSGSIHAFGGQMQKVVDAKGEHLPIWNDKLVSLATWLSDAAPVRAAPGTVLIRYNATYQDLIVRNDISPNVSVINFLNSNISVVNCTPRGGAACPTVSTQLSNGVLDLVETGLTVQHLNISNVKIIIGSGLHFTLDSLSSNPGSEIRVDGTLKVPNSFAFSDSRIDVFGSLIGATTLHMTKNCELYLSPPNARWNDGINTVFPAKSLNNTDIYTKYGLTTNIFITSNITLSSKSFLYFGGGSANDASRGILYTSTLHISANSGILADGLGYEATGLATTTARRNGNPVHPLHIASGNVSFGDGGWAAGRGGGYYYNYPSTGNAFYPIEMGKAGGSTYYTNGNNGGGVIRIFVKNQLILNGTLSANGKGCLSSTKAGGGGAGGSIWLEVEGSFSGSGQLSAAGGNGCATSGGAGSGGRIAVYLSDRSLNSFTGSFLVNGGNQPVPLNYVDGNLPFLASGGTMLFANYFSQGSEQVVSSNNGHQGSPVNVFSASHACDYPTGKDYHLFDTLLAVDIDLILNKCSWKGTKIGDASLASASEFPIGGVSTPKIIIENNASVVLTKPLVVDGNTILSIQSGHFYFNSNITQKDNSIIEIAPLHSSLIGLNQSFLNHKFEFLFNHLPVLTAFEDSLPFLAQPLEMTKVIADYLELSDQSQFNFLTTDSVGVAASNILRGRELSVGPTAQLSAVGVIRNPDFAPYEHNTLYTNYTFLGTPSGNKYGASGGGNAGQGAPGSSSNHYFGAARGDFLFPIGPGGAGGNDINRKIYGGAGGGGLLLEFSEKIVLNGKIDVSGESSNLNSAAGTFFHFLLSLF
jgi:hypothetical protein